jgi:hypothetical protein
MLDIPSAPMGMVVREEFLERLRTERAFREDGRRQMLTEDLLALPGRLDHVTELGGLSGFPPGPFGVSWHPCPLPSSIKVSGQICMSINGSAPG